MHKPVLPSAILAVALLLPAAATRAENIIFKDGFVLPGYVVRQKKTIIDPASNSPVELQEGFYLVDDGARAIIFSPSQVQDVEGKREPDDVGKYSMRRPVETNNIEPLPPFVEVLDPGAWDDRWDRVLKYRAMNGKTVSFNEHIQWVTPHYVAAESSPRPSAPGRYKGVHYYLTRELGAENVMSLLGQHPDLREKATLPAAEQANRRLRRIEFLVLAGWHDEAAGQLELAAQQFPAEKAKFEATLKNVHKLQAIHLAGALERAWATGRHGWVEKQLASFPEEGVPETTLAKLRVLRGKVETASEQLKEVKRFLEDSLRGVGVPEHRKAFNEAVSAILAEVDADNVGRLETFLTQARQAERQKKAKLEPALRPPELVALAVTGWLLGNTSSEAKAEAAVRMWSTREFVLKYQATHDADDRKKLLTTWEKGNAIAFDELAQLVAMLPPPEPEAKIPVGVTAMKSSDGQTYQLQLPAEYRHGRPYPLLIVCHSAGEGALAAINRWASLADDNGVIVAAPEWGKGDYGYTSKEHQPVLEMLRDLKQRFNIDSDRVFLAGYGAGGAMCYDVGLSHPDLFAGVLPMSQAPAPIVEHYRYNGQYLPFYVVSGDRSEFVYRANYYLFKDWILRMYPMLYVTYKGRGAEFFGEELKWSFDWMRHKRRAYPLKQLGQFGNGGVGGSEFVTVRSGDNRFYWLSTDQIEPKQLVEGPRPGKVRGGLLQGNILDNNQINVQAKLVKQVTVWLGRDRAGQNMVDLDKPVRVYINGAQRMKREVRPSIETLLEDLYERCDRQRLFYARLDFKL